MNYNSYVRAAVYKLYCILILRDMSLFQICNSRLLKKSLLLNQGCIYLIKNTEKKKTFFYSLNSCEYMFKCIPVIKAEFSTSLLQAHYTPEIILIC